MAKIEMKPIKGCKDYHITKTGELYSTKRGTPVRLKPNVFQGYERVKLSTSEGGVHNTTIHRLVAETFLRKPKNKNIVNHIDGVKNNNNVSNLEWTDHRGNMKHYGETLEKGYRAKRGKVKQDLEKAKQTILNLAYDLYSKTQTPDEFVKLYGAAYNL